MFGLNVFGESGIMECRAHNGVKKATEIGGNIDIHKMSEKLHMV